MANQRTRQQRRATERERGERLTSKPTQSKQRHPMLLAIGGILLRTRWVVLLIAFLRFLKGWL